MNQTEIDTLRAAHPEKWAALISAGFKPKRAAEVITAQLAEHARAEAENPPQERAAAKLKAAEAIVRTHLERASLAKGEYEKLLAELRAEFPELQIEVLTLDAPPAHDDAAAEKLSTFLAEIEQLKKDKALQAERIQQLEDAATEMAKALAAEVEAHNVCKSDAANQAAALQAAGDKITAALAAKSLKAAHEALS